MKHESFTFSFTTNHPAQKVFDLVLDVKQWWSGLYNEHLKGQPDKLNGLFTFEAGEGIHYSQQKLIALIPGKSIVWQVTDSNLTFLKEPNEWNGTHIRFDFSTVGKETRVTFTHQGLIAPMECYNACSDAWTAYLLRLKEKLS